MSTTLLTKVKRLQDMVSRREAQSPGSRWSGRDLAKRLAQMIDAEEARERREYLLEASGKAAAVGEGPTWAERMARNAARRAGLRDDPMEPS